MRGQSTFGGILGTIRDPSGARVARAAVTAKELDTGVSIQVASGGEGLYEFLNVKPGRYSVFAAKKGFADSASFDLALESRRTIRADLDLKLPDVLESVTVRAVDVAINTEDGTLADTKSFAQLTQLPLNFRGTGTNPTSLLFAVPGVQQDGINHPSIGGSLPTQVEYSVDGISTVGAFGGPLLQARGPWVTGGYYNDARSRQSFMDGWLRTGDVATIDTEGYIQIMDRTKDLVKSGGEWISSRP